MSRKPVSYELQLEEFAMSDVYWIGPRVQTNDWCGNFAATEPAPHD